MFPSRRRWSAGLVLAVGIALGWALATTRATRPVLASGADRWGDRIVVTGPIGIEMNPLTKAAIPQDAIYYLNYSNGRLLATIPTYRQSAGQTELLSDFAERDLLKDFAIPPGVLPHFMMSTVSLGARTEGWSPLVVFETETGQVAFYKLTMQATPGSSRPIFELLQRRADRRLAKANPPPGR
jgi:hypothetical protein